MAKPFCVFKVSIQVFIFLIIKPLHFIVLKYKKIQPYLLFITDFCYIFVHRFTVRFSVKNPTLNGL